MARDGAAFRAQVVSQPRRRALVSSARNLGKLPSQAKRIATRTEAWESTAWDFFDNTPEYHYSCAWVGNLLSKGKLIILKDGEPTDFAPAVDALAALFGGPEGQTEMLRQLGIHFTVAGEGYLIGKTVEGEDGEELDDWFIAAATEVSFTSGNDDPASDQVWRVGEETLTNPLMIRLWKPHPRKPQFSDCPTRAVLPILTELYGLTQHVAAQIDSRLASAGILVVPNNIDFGAAPAKTQPGTEDEKDSAEPDPSLVAELIRVASTALSDRTDPASMVPVVLAVDGEYVDKINFIKFWSGLDKQAIELRNEAIRRLALGMDMPPEVLEGSADMNHWSSWMVEEAAIKSHSEPLIAVIIRALTEGYLWPLLADQGAEQGESRIDNDEIKSYSIGVDTTGMRLRINRSKEAIEMYDRGALSLEAMLRENGFEPKDKMESEELREWFLRKAASGSTTPEIVEAAMRALAVPLGKVQPSGSAGQEARPTRSIAEHPARELPSQPAQNIAAIQIAGSLLVHRALERAGNRLRTRMSAKVPGVSAAETYRFVPTPTSQLSALLEDSWTQCESVAAELGLDPVQFRAQLDAYVRSLLTSQAEHNPELMLTYLTRELEPA